MQCQLQLCICVYLHQWTTFLATEGTAGEKVMIGDFCVLIILLSKIMKSNIGV